MIDKLIEKIRQTGNPTVVGLDPRLDSIPKKIRSKNFEKYGETPKAAASCLYEFNKGIIDNIYDIVPAVKPQIAMYELFGWQGIKAYIKTIKYAKKKGMIVIGDVKRGDISSTAEAYSDGHIGKAAIGSAEHVIYDEDFITLNPYLGADSIEPFFENCKKYEKGLFILVKTSNPGSGQIQNLEADGVMLYEKVGALVSEWGEGFTGKHGYSSIGAVVGVTHKSEAERLRKLMPHTFFLLPGYGAQGGKAEDVKVCFDKDGGGAIVNSSRGIIFHYKKNDAFSEKEYGLAAREAAIQMKNELNAVIRY